MNQDRKKCNNNIIQVHNKKEYNSNFFEGIISIFILLLESYKDKDVYALLWEELLFNNDKEN